MKKYVGITYPYMTDEQIKVWRQLFCPQHMHLFDEMVSVDGHMLVCDACGLEVHIDKISYEHVE